jgi:hypothetical protein
MQAAAAGRVVRGSAFGVAVQIDLGVHWALRLPLVAGLAGGGDTDHIELDFTPGLVYRFRDHRDQRWVPYLGGGLRLGLTATGRGLLGLPFVADPPAAQARDFLDHLGDHHHHHHDHHIFGGSSEQDDPNEAYADDAVPELWLGVEWHPTSWFCLNLAGSYAYDRVEGVGLHVFREMFGTRLTF